MISDKWSSRINMVNKGEKLNFFIVINYNLLFDQINGENLI